MRIFAETDRISLREITPDDLLPMFEVDSDPEVHKYLGKTPIATLDDAARNIEFIRQQYIDLGIGRWAIVDKATNAFVGWGGMKYRTDEVNGHQGFYDVGYRLLRRFWGQGFATESAKTTVRYAFEVMQLNAVYAMANVENHGSINALLKTGFKITNQLTHEGIDCHWFEMKAIDFDTKAAK